MWLITPFGFFSIVQKPEDADSGMLTVRARVVSDLQRLQHYVPSLVHIDISDESDYRFRSRVSRTELAQALSQAVQDIDYSNFKSAVAKRQNPKRASLYHEVWDVLYRLQTDPSYDPPATEPDSFGGVVVSGGRKVLLRQPRQQYGGYAWTFAKMAVGNNLEYSAHEIALQAVREKTGYQCVVRGELPGLFKGDTSLTQYFLMEAEHPPAAPNWQTHAVKWASFEDAQALIRQSSNEEGRDRDLAILAAAERALDRIAADEPLAVQPEDRGQLHPMPEQHAVLSPRLWYSAEDMVKIRRGFCPTVMANKWFLVFSGNRLKMYRSRTGYLIYDVGFAYDPEGGAYVSEVVVNRETRQYQQDDNDEDIVQLQGIILHHLLNPRMQPKELGIVQALKQAGSPNYLGSVDVVKGLLDPVFAVVTRDYLNDAACNRELDEQEQEQLETLMSKEIDRGQLMLGVIAALAGMNDEYTAMPGWHLTEKLGWNIMQYLAPTTSFTGDESLYELVAAGLTRVVDTAYALLVAYGEDVHASWDVHALAQLRDLQQFAAAVLMGTNTVFHAEKKLVDFHWQPAPHS